MAPRAASALASGKTPENGVSFTPMRYAAPRFTTRRGSPVGRGAEPGTKHGVYVVVREVIDVRMARVERLDRASGGVEPDDRHADQGRAVRQRQADVAEPDDGQGQRLFRVFGDTEPVQDARPITRCSTPGHWLALVTPRPSTMQRIPSIWSGPH